MRRLSTYIFVLLLCALTLSAAPIPPHRTLEEYETEKQTDQMLLLMQKRLAIMHEVARTKWNQKLPIDDPAREQTLLTGLVEQAKKQGLDEKWISKFFQAQFNAAKEIQRNDFSLWSEQGVQKFDSVLSLKDEIRLYIDQINQEILTLLSKLHGKDTGKYILDCPISIRGSDYIEEPVWMMAIAPLRS